MAPSTRDGYESKLRAHLLPRLGELPLSKAFDVTRSREIDVALVESGVCIATRRNVFLALRSVASFAVEATILAQVPAFLPLPKRGKRVPRAPPATDVAAVIDAASCAEHRLVILLAAHAGLRRGEIRALRCGDVELDNNRLVVRLSRYRNHTGTIKSGHERQVPLSPQLRAALIEARVDERPRDQEAALSTRGKPWGPSGPWQVFQSILRRLELPPERLHALRAFYVTILLSGHVPVHVVRELAGHEDLATTQGYAAILAPDRGAAVEVLDRVHRRAHSEAAARPRGAWPGRPTRRLGKLARRAQTVRARHQGARDAGPSCRGPSRWGCG
jgi:integrase